MTGGDLSAAAGRLGDAALLGGIIAMCPRWVPETAAGAELAVVLYGLAHYAKAGLMGADARQRTQSRKTSMTRDRAREVAFDVVINILSTDTERGIKLLNELDSQPPDPPPAGSP